MENFQLDARLAADCHVMAELKFSKLLLVNNSLVPWFILVPRTGETELIDLPPAERDVLYAEIHIVSEFVRENFEVTKLNIGAIGNIVRQMHIHVIGRRESDFCWPNVVWGTKEKEPYEDARVAEIKEAFAAVNDGS